MRLASPLGDRGAAMAKKTIKRINTSTNKLTIRTLFAAFAVIGLALIYLFQHFNYLEFLTGRTDYNPNYIFAFNRTIRFILNDLLAILLIWTIFYERKYVLVAFIIQAIGLFLVLPAYLILKLSIEGASEISSPLLSFLHRIIINPVMILLLIPAFFLQKKSKFQN